MNYAQSLLLSPSTVTHTSTPDLTAEKDGSIWFTPELWKWKLVLSICFENENLASSDFEDQCMTNFLLQHTLMKKAYRPQWRIYT